jgi:hypothetical protein
MRGCKMANRCGCSCGCGCGRLLRGIGHTGHRRRDISKRCRVVLVSAFAHFGIHCVHVTAVPSFSSLHHVPPNAPYPNTSR